MMKPIITFLMNEIRNLILTLGAAVLAALALSAYFVMNYGPTGRYQVSNTLLRPDLLSELNYNDYNPKTGGQDRFVFDLIEYSWYDEALRSWKKNNPTVETYQKFYQEIDGDLSLQNPPEIPFSKAQTITLFVRTESPAEWQKEIKTFQVIEIVHNDYYRIELHEDNKGVHWVYYNHPKIAEKAAIIFK